MKRLLTFACCSVWLAGCTTTTEEPASYGFGREVSDAEISQWDIDVTPDGHGLPAGGATAAAGAQVYQQKCFACHGTEGAGGPNDRLVLAWQDGVNYSLGGTAKTVGNYWPYATTLFDYIRRAMPHNLPGSLTDDEVYGLTAYLLELNGIIADGAVMNADTLPAVEMPARDLFYFSDEVP